MSKLLSSAAVGQRNGEDAKEILSAYIATKPDMVMDHTQENAASLTKGKTIAGSIDPTQR